MVANIVALGALTQLTTIVSVKSMETAVLGRVPKGTESLNRDALRAGIRAAKRAMEERKVMNIDKLSAVSAGGPSVEVW